MVKFTFLNTKNAILMTTLFISITSYYAATFKIQCFWCKKSAMISFSYLLNQPWKTSDFVCLAGWLAQFDSLFLELCADLLITETCYCLITDAPKNFGNSILFFFKKKTISNVNVDFRLATKLLCCVLIVCNNCVIWQVDSLRVYAKNRQSVVRRRFRQPKQLKH